MKRQHWIIVALSAVLSSAGVVVLNGCNMVEGAGEAVSAMGEGISEDARAAGNTIKNHTQDDDTSTPSDSP